MSESRYATRDQWDAFWVLMQRRHGWMPQSLLSMLVAGLSVPHALTLFFEPAPRGWIGLGVFCVAVVARIAISLRIHEADRAFEQSIKTPTAL